jgi:ribosomal protein S27E
MMKLEPYQPADRYRPFYCVKCGTMGTDIKYERNAYVLTCLNCGHIGIEKEGGIFDCVIE